MADLSNIAALILTQSERRAEVVAENLSNINTSGYKRQIAFSALLADGDPTSPSSHDISTRIDFADGKLNETRSPYDLAIVGSGFFTVGKSGQVAYTRQGQFTRDGDGRLLDARGYALQADGGGDLVLKGADFKVLPDGAVLQDGEPLGRLAIVDFVDRETTLAHKDGGLFVASQGKAVAVENPTVRQGMLETSNVSTGDEMVALMEALRRAESGQRVMSVYDDLLGRVITTLGQG